MASYRNRKPLRGMGAVRACIVIALIAVTGVQAVVDNEMTDEQFNHSEEMAKTELTKPEIGMKVFVYYTDKHNKAPILVPAVITSVNNMGKGPTEINVRYLDGSTVNSRVYLEDVFLRDETMSYANWALDGFDPRTMHANGQPRIATGSSSRPFVSAPSMGAASGGASKVGGAGKKRKTTDSKTGKQPMGHYMEDALYGKMDLDTAIAKLKHDGVWMLEKTLELNKFKARNAKLRAERDAAVERARQSDLRATAAEARVAFFKVCVIAAEVCAVHAEVSTVATEIRVFGAESRATAAEIRVVGAEARATDAEARATAAEARIAAAEARATAAEARAATLQQQTETADPVPPSTGVLNHSACRDFPGTGSGM